MGKKICKDKKKIEKKSDGKPRYGCKECGGLAIKEKHLCKPKKIK